MWTFAFSAAVSLHEICLSVFLSYFFSAPLHLTFALGCFTSTLISLFGQIRYLTTAVSSCNIRCMLALLYVSNCFFTMEAVTASVAHDRRLEIGYRFPMTYRQRATR